MSGENSNAPASAPDAAPPKVVANDDAPAALAESSKEATAKVDSKPAELVEPVGASAPAQESVPAEKSSEPPVEKADIKMTDEAASASAAATAADADESTASALGEQPATTPSKSKAKRKSVGGADAKGKKLNKKASKARILHLDATPGDHYFVKLKGFPQWPVIICDEDMLPQSLLKSRPVTARRPDGTYRDDYADGGKKAGDRTYPVMYLHTNEFGWVPNSDLIELDPTTVKDMKTDKMRKDLQAAHDLAAESHPISFYKDLLHQFQEDLIEQEKSKAAKATPKGKKAKAATEEDEDVEMVDAVDEDGTPPKEKKVKKRKAEESVETPQRSDSVKKPKIKITNNSAAKATNGTTPQAAKPAKAATEVKAVKPKTKKPKEVEEKKAEKEPTTPKEPEFSPEEKHQRKEKEVLFLRHKLQKGLLTRDQEPKEEEMKMMSEYILKLEGFPDLEVSIIRATKINKVLKAILKLDNIPKEDEFQFKPRSQSLLDKWNKLLAVDGAPAEGANGVNGTKEAAKTNGVKEKNEAAAPEKPKEETKDTAKVEEASATAEKPTVADEPKAPEAVGATS